jgi:Tfp pilus assembly protein PilN
LVVLTNNQISDREAQQASLESQVQQAQDEAKRLDSFVNFASLEQAREQTVANLAESRFDWERVLRELAIVIPRNVWLTNLDAKASADASTSSSSSSSSSSSEDIQGPSLDINGCAAGHEAVAEFLAALREVDGVTRATVMSSDRQGDAGATGGSTSSTSTTSSGSTGAGCASKDFIATFEVVVAFDTAQPATSTGSVPPTSAPSPTTTTSTAPTSEPTTTTPSAEQTPTSAPAGGGDRRAQAKDSETFVAGAGSTP